MINKSLMVIYFYKVIKMLIKPAWIIEFFKSVVKYVIIKFNNKEHKPKLKITSAFTSTLTKENVE